MLLEQAVCSQLAGLTEMQHETADFILFRINLLWSLLNKSICVVPNLQSHPSFGSHRVTQRTDVHQMLLVRLDHTQLII